MPETKNRGRPKSRRKDGTNNYKVISQDDKRIKDIIRRELQSYNYHIRQAIAEYL